MIVADANILAHYMIEGERTADVHRLWALDDEWMVPVFWRIEFQSILWKLVRFNGMSEHQALALLDQAMQLFSGNEHLISHDAALREGMASGINVYDAQYVSLARQLGVPCVTLDAALRNACPDTAISIEQFIRNLTGDSRVNEVLATYKKKSRRKRAGKKRAAGK